ncbi:MAG: hypothetical protein QOI66_4636, partial [Myxococcales bacterium]|nr:hypothetical protein [Myxococcales bacterium]
MISSYRGPSRHLATALVCAICLLGVAARNAQGADDPKRQARAAMTKGSALFQKGDYESALRAFNEAQALYPSPKIYFNLGQTYRKLDRVAEAVEAFEKFLKEAPDAAPARRKDAEKFLNELRPRLAALRAAAAAAAATTAAPPESTVAPEAAPVAQPTPPPPMAPAPAPVAQPPALAAAPKLTLDTPRPSPSPPPALETSGGVPPGDRAPPPERRWWPWAIAGALLAGGIAAALLITRDGPLPEGSLGHADE